jgi:hypothetical protein
MWNKLQCVLYNTDNIATLREAALVLRLPSMFSAWKKPTPTPQVEPSAPRVLAPTAYRRFLRSSFMARARLNLGGQFCDAQVLDMSLKGALVDVGLEQYCPVGARGRLRLMLTPTIFIAMDVVVMRLQDTRLGLRCVHIDLDSVTHLRQLMERNALDPSMLARELYLLTCPV